MCFLSAQKLNSQASEKKLLLESTLRWFSLAVAKVAKLLKRVVKNTAFECLDNTM